MAYLTTSMHIRKLDVKKDLLQVADLIEMCFINQMDADGKMYVRNIREAAKDSNYQRWLPGAGEWVSYPLFGFVWEEYDQIVGNLSLIPFFHQARWIYMIANVAVHPDYRNQGIAKKLTKRAIEHARNHRVHALWLHVREHNQAAYNLYLQHGFKEKAKRTNWQKENTDLLPNIHENNIDLRKRRNRDWPLQSIWLNELYPKELQWNLRINRSQIAGTMFNQIVRFFGSDPYKHWAAYRNAQLIGTISWEPTRFHADNLWLATSERFQNAAIKALLPYVQTQLRRKRRPLVINFPSNRAEEAFLACGYLPLNTLIWMEHQLR
jgi:ribosomal protein S18 acetylase RimI-like enzyme